jgi:repressor LexA
LTAENSGHIVENISDSTGRRRSKRVGGHVWLMPENPAYDPIPGDEAKILGRVVYVSRTLN